MEKKNLKIFNYYYYYNFDNQYKKIFLKPWNFDNYLNCFIND